MSRYREWKGAFGAPKFLQFIPWKYVKADADTLYPIYEHSIRMCVERRFDFSTAHTSTSEIIFANKANMVTLELEELDI